MTDRVVVVRPQPERVVVRGGLPGPKGEPGTIQRTTVATAAYTAVLGDANKVVRMTFAGAATLTIPANATAAFALDTIINAYAAGGALTIAAAAGVTIRNNGAALTQNGECSLRKDGTDEWVRVG